jgi:hypothetical protein
MKRTIDDLSTEQRDAILAYAARHGRTWKAKLNDDWQTGRDCGFSYGYGLRSVRNQFGPKWLASVTL